jgi:hypothetical protein
MPKTEIETAGAAEKEPVEASPPLPLGNGGGGENPPPKKEEAPGKMNLFRFL